MGVYEDLARADPILVVEDIDRDILREQASQAYREMREQAARAAQAYMRSGMFSDLMEYITSGNNGGWYINGYHTEDLLVVDSARRLLEKLEHSF